MRAYLIGHLDKFIGGLSHRRHDRYDPMTTPVQIGETSRDRAAFCRCFETGAAVFLHDDGIVAHSTLRNTSMSSSCQWRRREICSLPREDRPTRKETARRSGPLTSDITSQEKRAWPHSSV